MATSVFLTLFAAAAATLLLSPAAWAQTCSSQTFPNNSKYQRCVDLPVLKAFIHWTYDSAAKPKPTLSIAFGAPPAKQEGWVSWAPNPKADGMVGAQAFVAFKGPNGAVTVKTYNMSGYKNITEGNIAYDVLDKSGLAGGGMMWIFAKIATSDWPEEVNYVWQIGSEVMNGNFPAKHDFQQENLAAKAKMRLSGDAPSPLIPPSGTSLPPKSPATPAPESPRHSDGGYRVRSGRIWVYGCLVLVGAMILGL